MTQHSRVVQGLIHGDAFDHPAFAREMIETHISSLVLAGEFVYKLRKPLRLDFLDFSTPELRRVDCEEELRLNRRTAASVYLDVVPVLGSLAQPRIGNANSLNLNSAQPLDWALRMRRFDNALLLDRLARKGALTPRHIDALVRRIAVFHATLPPSPPKYGHPTGMFAWVRSNLDDLSASPLARHHGAHVASLLAWTQREFERLAPLLAQRREQGWVRECHGDLHLGNIVLIGGEPLPFDCIEFNAELRHIDVMSEVAFTFMDLLLHRLPRLAWRFLSAYLEQGGDYPGVATLTFFAVYRALVRAKVALIRAEQAQANEELAGFESNLALARHLTTIPSPEPLLVLTSGVSGSGKSTVAQELVETLGAVRIRSDVERKRLFGHAATERAGAELYTPEATRRTYEHIGAQARSVLQAGLHAIVDAACLLRHERDALRATANELGARFALLECTAPEAVLRARVAQRLVENRDASDATVGVLDRQLRVREPIAPEEGAHVLDTQSDPAALSAQALTCMQQHTP